MASEFPSPDDIEVAEILLQLPQTILRRESRSRPLDTWGSKRKRSASRRESGERLNEPAVFPIPPLPPPPPRPEVKAEATSPATPLSFSPSESDSKRKHRKRKSHHHHKKKREDWLEIMNELTQRKELMLKEIENVSRYYDKLKVFNLQLKARKEELISTGLKMETPDSNEGQSSRLASLFNHQHHPPSNPDRTAQIPSIVNDVSPLGIPDLNVPIDESFADDAFQPLDSSMAKKDRDQSRALASEARRKRIQICRVKNSSAANKQRYLYR